MTGGWRAQGCLACGKTGFQGRTGVHELLLIDDEIRSLIHRGESEAKIRQAGREQGSLSMREDGQRWVDEGITSLDEIIRVTRD